jgi:hypothetical protein
VYINCYIRAGPDFKLFKIEPPTAKGFFIRAEAESSIDLLPERISTKADFRVIANNSDNIPLLVFGEHTISIKQMTSKPCFSRTLNLNNTALEDFIKIPFPTKVPQPQFCTLQLGSTILGALSPGFLAQRGGLRWKVVFIEQSAPPHTVVDPTSTVYFVSMENVRSNDSAFTEIGVNTDNIVAPVARVYQRNWESSALEFAVPALIRSRFQNVRRYYSQTVHQNLIGCLWPVLYILAFDDNGPGRAHVFTSGDEDCSLHGYYCGPRAVFNP